MNILKRYSWVVFLGMGCYLFSFWKDERLMNSDLSDEDRILYGFVAREGELLGKKYHMSQCGVGGGVNDDGIRLMSLDFQRYGPPLTEAEARSLIVNCINDYLEAVNEDKKLRPFLKVYPFKPKNIDLAIFNYHPIDRTPVLPPNIFIVASDHGEVSYLTQDPKNKLRFESEKYESYDEALLILQKQNGSDGKETQKRRSSSDL